MCKNMAVALLVWLFLLQIATSQFTFHSSYAKRLSYMNDTIPETSVINQFTNVSRIVCGINCFQQKACVSYFYDKQTSTCSIHDTLFPASSRESQILQAGLEYYHLLGRPEADCSPPYRYLDEVSICVLAVEERMNWFSAATWCLSQGGHLLIPDTPAKSIQVAQYINNYMYSDDYEETLFYIGGWEYSKAWHWANGEEIDDNSFYWELGYPHPLVGGWKFLVISAESGGRWMNERNMERYFICQKDVVNV